MPAQKGQPAFLSALEMTEACHSWCPQLLAQHCHQALKSDPSDTLAGVLSPFLLGCHYSTSSGLLLKGGWPAPAHHCVLSNLDMMMWVATTV